MSINRKASETAVDAQSPAPSPGIKTPPPRTTPRAAYRQSESLRIDGSPSLAAKYRTLKSLTVDLAFYEPRGVTKNSEIKYTVNLDHAKSVFSFACQNHECVGGDFDLSQILATAVSRRQSTVTGERCCTGWRSRTTMGTKTCDNLLRYKLTLKF